MIFVTVGTHEQPFNRLIEKIDELKGKGIISEEVFMQIGYSTYEPKHCMWEKLIPYQEMEQYMNKADKIITHGGPATFMSVLSKGKKPIVVPRLVEFGEHVNNHQLDFAQKVLERGYQIVVITDLNNNSISKALRNNLTINKTNNNNSKFISAFKNRIKEVL